MSAEAESVQRGNLDKLLRKIESERSFDASQYRQAYLERRLAVRLRALGLVTYSQYARYLDLHAEEYDLLIDALTINVTEFFRDQPVWDTVSRDVLPEVLAKKEAMGQRSFRAWSAGCATGEEPYSMVMAILDALGAKGLDFHVHVLATDLDPKALGVARAGEYDLAKLQQIPRVDRLRYLEAGEERFRVRPEVARHVDFKRLNLFDDCPINVMDLVFCRNVFIYFTREQQERVLERFRSVLRRGGYLVLGRSEKLPPSQADAFELVSGPLRIYRVPSAPNAGPLPGRGRGGSA